MKTKIIDRVDEEPPKNMPTEIVFPFIYMRTKACNYLTIGPNKYRKVDYFHMPKERDKKTLALIKSGATQIVDYKGWNQKNPLTKIGIKGFYSLMATFHFELVYQKTIPNPLKSIKPMKKNNYCILDKMTMKHIPSNETIILYNLVEYK